MVGLIGIGLSLLGTSASFVQASKQRKKASQAELAAEKAMEDARKKLEINYYKNLGINREPYELARDAASVTATNLIQAGVESERGAGAVAGRVQMAQNENQGQIRTAMGNEMQDLNKLVATEDARLNNIGLNLDLATVEGANKAAANYENMSNNSLTQGLQGLSSLGGQVLAESKLYKNDMVGGNLAQLEQNYNQQIQSGTLPDAYKGANGQPLPFQTALQTLTGQQSLDPNSFQQFLQGQNKDYYEHYLKTGFVPLRDPNAPLQLGQNKTPYNNWNFNEVTYK